MRLPRLWAAGVLLLAAVFLLVGLFAQPPFASVGVVTFAVFRARAASARAAA